MGVPPRGGALPGKRRSALVFKQKFDLILVLRLSEVSIREHNLSSIDSAAAAALKELAAINLNSPPYLIWGKVKLQSVQRFSRWK